MQPRSQGSVLPVSEGTCTVVNPRKEVDDDVGNDKNVMIMYHNDNYFLSKRIYRKVSCFWPLSLFLAQSFYTSPCQYPNAINTVWHEIFAGSKFCDFSSDQQKQVPANKNYCKHFFPQEFTPE